MCGIAGFVGQFTKQQLDVMVSTIAHRGPDDDGVYLNQQQGVGLGHRRLSIVDLGGGHQPMSNEDGTVWLVFNGEIYNHEQLRSSLIEGHRFRTSCDTEVIIHLYEEYGASCVDHLEGMFAFAIWDENQSRLFLARDRFGIKPLYYADTGAGFAFASEAKSLLRARITDAAVDREAIGPYLTFRYVPEDRTMFAGIKKLLPGHTATYIDGNLSTELFWQPSFAKTGRLADAECVEEFTVRLKKAVDMRLMSEVPLGAFLSGGLDSSFIVALMAQLQDRPVETFTAELDGAWHDESAFASIVARAFATNHHQLRVGADAASVFGQVIWHLDEPLGDAAAIPTFVLSALTREFVTVALSGEGADELLGGYGKYRVLRLAGWIRSAIGGSHWGGAARLSRSRVRLNRSLEFLRHKDDTRAYLDFVGVFSTEEKGRLLNPTHRALADPEVSESIIKKYFFQREEGLGPLDKLVSLDVGTWLPNDVLLKVDKMSMAHSLEARVPFLDHVFAEFMFSLPARMKLGRFQNKVLLRKAMAGLVPKKIVRRPKHGFTVPVHTWMKGALRRITEKAFSTERIEELGYWNPRFVTDLLKRDLNNEFYRRQVWTLLAFDLWHRVFVEGAGPNAT